MLPQPAAQDSIRLQLLSAEDDFLEAINQGADAASTCKARLIALQKIMEDANDLSPSIWSLASVVCSRISILAESFLSLHTSSIDIEASLFTSFDTIFNSAELQDYGPYPSESDSLDEITTKTLSSPPYIASAYKWLRNNLHKPYPTIEELKAICADSNTTEKRIRSWFASARRRMGWTRIAKDYFLKDKGDTADAAYRALIEPDPKRPLDLKLMVEFVKMQVAAEGMYSAAFKPTQFVGRLSTVVVGMSPEHQACLEQMRQQVIEEENMQQEAEYRIKLQRLTERRDSKRRSVSSYPSPERSSRGGSPQPTLVSSDTEGGETDTPSPTVAAGRKRRRSSAADEDSSANKRPRNRSIPHAEEPPIALPSPPASIDGNVTDAFDYWTSGDDLTPDLEPSVISVSRKRRLSDADGQRPPKRPASLAVGPRLRPVSDPLPRPSVFLQSSEFPDWNLDNMVLDFNIPDAVTSQPLDPSEPLHVEFFNWANDASSGANTPHLSSESPSPVASQEINLPASELLSLATNELNIPGSPSAEFRQFLQDFPMFPQSTQPQIAEDSPIFQPNIPQALPMVSQTMSAPITITSDCWNPTPIYSESHSQNFDFSDLDLSLSKSPPSPADIIAQGEAAARQIKLNQLRAHLEAAEKLKEELSST